MECCRLRIKDIEFSRNGLIIRSGKGDKDRHSMLPTAIKEALFKHIEANRSQHQEDLKKGLGRVALPNALARKYPNARSAAIVSTSQFCREPSAVPSLGRG